MSWRKCTLHISQTHGWDIKSRDKKCGKNTRMRVLSKSARVGALSVSCSGHTHSRPRAHRPAAAACLPSSRRSSTRRPRPIRRRQRPWRRPCSCTSAAPPSRVCIDCHAGGECADWWCHCRQRRPRTAGRAHAACQRRADARRRRTSAGAAGAPTAQSAAAAAVVTVVVGLRPRPMSDERKITVKHRASRQWCCSFLKECKIFQVLDPKQVCSVWWKIRMLAIVGGYTSLV